jgi:transposase
MAVNGLVKAKLPAVCVDARHVHAVVRASTNKTDRKDARAIAQLRRFGMFRAVHVKSLASQHIRTLLSSRRLLQSKLIDIENSVRALLRNFGLKIGAVTRPK